MGFPRTQKAVLACTLALLAPAMATAGEPADNLAEHALTGMVTTRAIPLAQARVYAYQMNDLTLRRVDTDLIGSFLFEQLPAGLYKIIAVKAGFVPAVVLLQRQTAQAAQYLAVDLAPQRVTTVKGRESFWSLREKIPADVLRDLETLEMAESDSAAPGSQLNVAETRFQAMTGVDDRVGGPGQMNRGTVGMRGSIGSTEFDVAGDQWVARADAGSEASHSSQFSVRVNNPDTGSIRMTTSNQSLDSNDGYDAVDLDRYQVSWSQQLGPGSSSVRAEVVDESNFFSSGLIRPAGLPGASRSTNLEGSYEDVVVGSNSLSAGFRFRQVDSAEDDPSNLVPSQRIDLFGRGRMLVRPRVAVHYGLYSTLRDGSLSLAPRGGVVVDVGSDWTVSTMASRTIHEDDPAIFDFVPVQYAAATSECRGEAYCYQLAFSRRFADETELSVGASHRRFDETLQLYFNDDFFGYLESLLLVDGDRLPEVQVAMSHRITPRIMARLESSIASGGGGVFYATDDNSYENSVRYIVTSVDAQFEATDTGVFVAFHQLEQQLLPMSGSSREPALRTGMETQRLQLMLTQDLSALHLASLALRLNMEVSRGDMVRGGKGSDEIRKRVMGGVALTF